MERLAKDRHLPSGIIIICEINRLKKVNDTMGHQKGDALFQKTADLLKRAFRTSDIITRIGGKNLLFYFPGMTNGALKTAWKKSESQLKIIERKRTN